MVVRFDLAVVDLYDDDFAMVQLRRRWEVEMSDKGLTYLWIMYICQCRSRMRTYQDYRYHL